MTKRPPYQIATDAIHAGEIHDATGAHIAPIYQTSTFTFPDMHAVEAYGAGESDAYIYTRPGHPGRKALAAKLAALEGYGLIRQAQAAGTAVPDIRAEIFSSGMGAISAALMGLAQAGDHIIAQEVLYGSADHLIAETLPQFGVTSSRVKGLETAALAQELAAHPNTTTVYLETPANPTMGLIDLAAVVEVAHAHNAKVVVDNTFATPILQRPLEFGADVVVHSTTKYIGGHGTIIGGAVVSRDDAFMEEQIAGMMRYVGAVPSPFDIWLTNLGLKTLPLRMKQHSVNGLAVAEFLEGHEGVTAVHYPGLPSFPQHDLAKRQMDDFGAMIAFEVPNYEAATRLLGRLELITLAVSLGNLDTLIEHPASMTHRSMEPAHRTQIGISDGLIRLSVGLEAAEDIIADLEQALG